MGDCPVGGTVCKGCGFNLLFAVFREKLFRCDLAFLSSNDTRIVQNTRSRKTSQIELNHVVAPPTRVNPKGGTRIETQQHVPF